MTFQCMHIGVIGIPIHIHVTLFFDFEIYNNCCEPYVFYCCSFWCLRKIVPAFSLTSKFLIV